MSAHVCGRSDLPDKVAEAASGIDQLLLADFLGATAVTDITQAADAILHVLRASHRAGHHSTAGERTDCLLLCLPLQVVTATFTLFWCCDICLTWRCITVALL